MSGMNLTGLIFLKKESAWEIKKGGKKEYREGKQRQWKVTGSPVVCSMSEILGIQSEFFNKLSSESINRIKLMTFWSYLLMFFSSSSVHHP